MMAELHEVVHEVVVDLDAATEVDWEVVLDTVVPSQPDLLVHEVVHEVVQVDVHEVVV